MFEGVDGAGKSSLIDVTAQYLDDRGIPWLSTKTPSETIRSLPAWRAWSDGSAGIPRSAIHGYGLNVLALADRLVHQAEVVEPALRNGRWVLCEKYVLTSLGYESDRIHEELASLLVAPDLGIVVDVQPEEAVARLRARRTEDEHPDDASEIATLRERLLALANPNGYVVIDTSHASVESAMDELRPRLDRLPG